MELREIYAFYLHGEKLKSLGATESQRMLCKLMELYPDAKALHLEVTRLAAVRKRHEAGIEFCGGTPRSRVDPAKIALIIKGIKSGKTCKDAANEAGASRCWALRKLHSVGYEFDANLKQWINGNNMRTQTFEIDGHTTTLKRAEPGEKMQRVIELIETGHSMKEAAFLVDIDSKQALQGMHSLGYTYVNKKWVRQSVTPATDSLRVLV